MFGLFAFLRVAAFHGYLVLDRAGKLGELWQDIIKRPYHHRMLALCLLIPLAVAADATAAIGRR
jgi:DMSO/TMAO reductase YedYZ heme-binding membrane subunit